MKQLIRSLAAQPVIATVTLVGTALAIFLIMVVVMIQQVNVVPFSPESNRDRFLHWTCSSLANESWGDGSANGPSSWTFIQEMLKPLETAETVTAYGINVNTHSLSLRGQRPISAAMRETDADYFHVFDHHFIAGAPYTQADFDAGLPKAVISRDVARKVFQTTDAVGRELLIDLAPYTVTGVVDNVSELATKGYAEVWIPFTSTNLTNDTWNNGYMGMLAATILAPSRSDFPAIREELTRRGEALNSKMRENGGFYYIWRNRPYDQETEMVGEGWANVEPDLKAHRRQNLVVFLILLIVPAINLSSMTQSRLQQRMAEVGVRRAYGATRWQIASGLVTENLVITLAAGIVGLLLSLLFAWLFSPSLFGSMSHSAPKVSMEMLFHWSTFLYALLFCFVLNLLSSGVPAWRAARHDIVNSLASASR